MKTILRFAAVAVLVAGSMACRDKAAHNDPVTTSDPAVTATETSVTTTDAAVTATETTATTETSATTATDPAAPTATDAPAPAPTATQ